MEGKQNIKDIPLAKIPETVKQLGLKNYAANQLIQWLYQKGAVSFDEMTNLSKPARSILSEHFYISDLKLTKTLKSSDGTKKFAWKLADGNVIESVLIPSEPYSKIPSMRSGVFASLRHGADTPVRQHANTPTRLTLCLSTQIGCAMGCAFCRTAGMGFVRNLTQSEILDQILSVAAELAKTCSGRACSAQSGFATFAATNTASRITNVVLMGMGEPLANYDNVLNAIKIMIDTKCLGLSRRHVTLSTCGLIPEIEKFAKENLRIKLAISLNATTDKQREQLMPINKRFPIAKLFEVLKKYSKAVKTPGRITFEYVMINDFNDSMDDAKRLVKFLSRFSSKVNLIPLNPCGDTVAAELALPDLSKQALTPHSGKVNFAATIRPPTEESIQRFAQYLRNKNIQVNIRSSRGQDILAACGQLASG